MEALRLAGGNPLYGEIRVQGSKNAALPMMAAALLSKEEIRLQHVPDIADVRMMQQILNTLGCVCRREGEDMVIDAGQIRSDVIPTELSGCMRSSVLLLGSMLARNGSVQLSRPGGCSIGGRPIDFHLDGFRKMGAEILETEEAIIARVTRLQGTKIRLPYPSVGATENLLLAATLAEGVTVLENCAREPEIAALCQLLVRMGAQILGIGTSRLVIAGCDRLHGARMYVEGDRIVAGTWLLCIAACGGMAEVADYRVEQLKTLYPLLRKSGCMVLPWRNRILIQSDGRLNGVGRVETAPYPGFPTDLQSLLLAAMAVARGNTQVAETVFENRFLAVPELVRMGARISVEGNLAKVEGVGALHGAVVKARDLRGGASLVLAGLAAEGETFITDCGHILRGYEALPEKLQALGAIVGGMNGEQQA